MKTDQIFIIQEDIMNKKLVAYFSASGVTKRVSEKLAEFAQADIYEIKPEVLYTNEDLDWRNQDSRSSVEMKDLSFRPAIADKNANISEYDTIYLGFPIWWYMAPTIINTFLESYDFAGKEIIIFATAGSSDFGKTVENLEGSCPGATIKTTKVLKGQISEEDIKSLV